MATHIDIPTEDPSALPPEVQAVLAKYPHAASLVDPENADYYGPKKPGFTIQEFTRLAVKATEAATFHGFAPVDDAALIPDYVAAADNPGLTVDQRWANFWNAPTLEAD